MRLTRAELLCMFHTPKLILLSPYRKVILLLSYGRRLSNWTHWRSKTGKEADPSRPKRKGSMDECSRDNGDPCACNKSSDDILLLHLTLARDLGGWSWRQDSSSSNIHLPAINLRECQSGLSSDVEVLRGPLSAFHETTSGHVVLLFCFPLLFVLLSGLCAKSWNLGLLLIRTRPCEVSKWYRDPKRQELWRQWGPGWVALSFWGCNLWRSTTLAAATAVIRTFLL
jgi:hypothetical protein